MTTRDVVFLFVSIIAAVGALLAVTSRQVVHAALWLVVTLATLAGCYVVLGNELVAVVQLLIYVGAVVVLVIFALMLTRSPMDVHMSLSTSSAQRTLAAIAGAGLTGLVAGVFLPLATTIGSRQPNEADTQAIAKAIFGTWVWPFELLSVLLLVSLIGAFAVSRVVGAAPERRRALRSARFSGPPMTSAPASSEANVTEVSS